MHRTSSALLALVVVASCGDEESNPAGPTGPPTGSLHIMAMTSGHDLDVDGYLVWLAGEQVGRLASLNDTLVVTESTGSYAVALTDVASNCEAVPTQLEAAVSVDQTSELLFEVSCEPLPMLVRDLGTLGFVGSEAYEINNRGAVIGGLHSLGVMHTEVWDYFLYSDGAMVELPTGWTGGLNDAGQIAACNYHWPEGLCRRTLVWDAGVVIDVGSFGDWSAPYDISESGAVVGASKVDSLRHAYHWDGTAMLDLGVPPGCDESEAIAVNESDQVLVSCWDLPDRTRRSSIWESGVFENLGSLYAVDLNNDGTIAGYTYDGAPHAAKWSQGVLMTLEVPAENEGSRASVVNEAGDIAGYYKDAEGTPHALLWRGDQSVDLGEGWTPRAINDSGSVVGHGFYGPAYYWSQGLLRELPALEEGCAQYARDINNREQIVGDSCERAVLWEKEKPDPD